MKLKLARGAVCLKISALVLVAVQLIGNVICEQDLAVQKGKSSESKNDTETPTKSGHSLATSGLSGQQLGLKRQENGKSQKELAAKGARGGRMLDLDRLAGELGSQRESSASGNRQSRRLEPVGGAELEGAVEGRSKKGAKGPKRMAIKGFIPIMSLEGPKEGKQLESLGEQLASAMGEGDHEDEPEEAAEQQQQQQGHQLQQMQHTQQMQPILSSGNEGSSGSSFLRDHLASNFGAQTSIGHASFGAPATQVQTAASDARWQLATGGPAGHSAAAAEQQELGRARKLLLAADRHPLRPLLATGLVSNLIQHPHSSHSPLGLLAGPMNPPGSQSLAPSHAYSTSGSGHGHALGLGEPAGQWAASEQCICVPFFQCKGGYLAESQLAKSQLAQLSAASASSASSPAPLGHWAQVPRSLNVAGQQFQTLGQPQGQLHTQGQSSLSSLSPSQPADQQMVNDIFEQLKKNLEAQNVERELLQQQLQQVQQQQQLQQQYSLINERTGANASASYDLGALDSGAQTAGQTGAQTATQTASQTANQMPSQTPSQSLAETEERGLLQTLAANANRRQSPAHSGPKQCGLMRTCCRVPPALRQGAPPARFVQRGPSPQYQLLGPPPRAPQLASQGQQSTPSELFADYLAPAAMQSQQQWSGGRPAAQQALTSQPLPSQAQQIYQMQQAPSVQQASNNFQQASSSNFQPLQSVLQAGHTTQPHTPAHTGQFMGGRCGLRPTLGISGRVQNVAPSGGEQAHQAGEQASADFGEFPAHAAILRRLSPADSLFVCSAVLLSGQWLATAAHCLKRLRPDQLKVRLGEWDVSRDDEFYPHLEANVREIVLHPDFQPTSLINDLALIRLDQSVGASEQMPHISPACLAQPDEQFAGQRCWVAGWGKDAFGQSGAFQSTLRKVDLPVVGQQECEAALRQHTRLGKYFRLHQNNICAGGERGKDACEGDGGAGLYCQDALSGLTKAVGLVSWGVGCGQRGVPGVYVNLNQYGGWIEQVVAASGEENLYSSSSGGDYGALGGRQQQQQPPAGIISERANGQPNDTMAQPQELAARSSSQPLSLAGEQVQTGSLQASAQSSLQANGTRADQEQAPKVHGENSAEARSAHKR